MRAPTPWPFAIELRLPTVRLNRPTAGNGYSDVQEVTNIQSRIELIFLTWGPVVKVAASLAARVGLVRVSEVE
jgi:hypothetical protein